MAAGTDELWWCLPLGLFPSVLQRVVEWNPVSAVTQAIRELFGNAAGPTSDAWAMQHPLPYTLLWIVLILAVFVPLSIRQYKRSSLR